MTPATRLMIEKLSALAERGFGYVEAAKEIGSDYGYVAGIAAKYKLKFKLKKRGAKPKTNPDVRDERMRTLYIEGKTLAEIGKEYNITRERVRQILTKNYGIRAVDGGRSVLTRRAKKEKSRRRDAHAQKKFGCSYQEYRRILKHPSRPTFAFLRQKGNASTRGIVWELNLWQWWSIWKQSGHWSERSRGRGYQMCRLNDVGPYSVDNVYIATGVENIQDYWADVKSGARNRTVTLVSPEHKKAVRKAAADRYQKTPKYKLRYELRRLGIPKEQRDAIFVEHFGASS